jgi:hypothetical protein
MDSRALLEAGEIQRERENSKRHRVCKVLNFSPKCQSESLTIGNPKPQPAYYFQGELGPAGISCGEFTARRPGRSTGRR